MKEQFTNSYFQYFRMQSIIFNNSENLTITGTAEINGESKFVNLFTDFKVLDKILKSEYHYGGEKIVWALSNRLATVDNTPSEIRIKDYLKDDLYISDLFFIISSGEIKVEPNQNAVLDFSLNRGNTDHFDNCYGLEDIIHIPGFYSLNPNLFPPELYDDLNEISKLYQFYLHLIEIGYSDGKSKQIFQFENKLLFDLAEKLYKTIKPEKLENPVKLLHESLEKIVKTYPQEIVPVKSLHYFKGTAFFPGGDGLYKEEVSQKVEFPFNKIMVLGQDFSNISYLEKAKKNAQKNKPDNELNSPTWKNLIKILGSAEINLKDCYYTNAIIGARNSESSIGPSPAFNMENKKFADECFEFFKKQIEIQRPNLIIALGVSVIKFLGRYISELKYFEEVKTLKEIDIDKKAFIENVRISQDLDTVNLVIIHHPSFYNLNVKYRVYKSLKGDPACIKLLRDAVKASFPSSEK